MVEHRLLLSSFRLIWPLSLVPEYLMTGSARPGVRRAPASSYLLSFILSVLTFASSAFQAPLLVIPGMCHLVIDTNSKSATKSRDFAAVSAEAVSA